MRFARTCYRAHDPRWSFKPLSGDGAAVHGGRFNRRGLPALYLALSIETAVREANQGFAFKIDPCVLCSYEVDCADVADLRTDAGRTVHKVEITDLDCAWFALAASGQEPPSWRRADRLMAEGMAGIIVPSFAPGATEADQNLVLWTWNDSLPHRVRVFDPGGRLPKNQLSWD
ncbi:RES domain-containing protein [Xanthobacteraceae bacterium Astr-EGSB]|uniref:RES family NAD+ phosphorylase n=1 Tax=Astrobacterium formosum TaxID=3069710 RepID=UPI0027B29784|nr:RES domain-containing protein [Xanthobacteraceae bacterium Astr-EGSB]